MALKVLYNGGWRDSLSTLREADFTRDNTPATGWSNDTITTSTPRGALAGHIAFVSDTNEVGVVETVATTGPFVQDYQLKGVFILDVASSPFENQPALGSGKLAVLSGRSVVEVDVYETHDSSDVALNYNAGDPLYASQRGLLTNASGDAFHTVGTTTSTKVVGVVRTAPADNNGKLVAELFL